MQVPIALPIGKEEQVPVTWLPCRSILNGNINLSPKLLTAPWLEDSFYSDHPKDSTVVLRKGWRV